MALMMRTIFILFIVFVSLNINAQISGTVNVPGTYPNLSAALSAINASGINGNTTIEMSANETAPVGGFYLTNFTGNDTYSLTLKAIGNITLTAPVGNSNTLDGIFIIEGASNVTIDGFTFAESVANTTPLTSMEWGIALLNNSATIGSNNCAIKNCTINFAGTTNTNAVGIYAAHHTKTNTTPFTVQQNSGAFSGLEISGNSFNAIYASSVKLIGAYNIDNQIVIGKANAPNLFKDFGGSSANCHVVYCENINQLSISNNVFNNLLVINHTGVLFGISTNKCDFITIEANLFKLSQGSSGSLCAISFSGFGRFSIKIKNNTITNTKIAQGTALLYGIYAGDEYKKIEITDNKFIDNTDIATDNQCYMVYHHNENVNLNDTIIFRNNIIKNFSRKVNVSTGNFYGYYLPLNNLSIGGNNDVDYLENNLFENIKGSTSTTFNGSIYGIYNYDFVTHNFRNLSIKNNIFRDFGNTKGDIVGIYAKGGKGIIVEKNIVENMSSGGRITGILINGFEFNENIECINNKINNLNSSNADVVGCQIISFNSYLTKVHHDTITNLMSNKNIIGVELVQGQFSLYDNIIKNMSAKGVLSGIVTNQIIKTSNLFNNNIENLSILQNTNTQNLNAMLLGGDTVIVYNNTIRGLTNASANGYVLGMNIDGLKHIKAYQNIIKELTHTSGTTNAIVAGIYARNTVGIFYNNIISELYANTSTALSGINAIMLENGSTNCSFYHNTIKLQGIANGCGVAALYVGSFSKALCQNNILYVDFTVPTNRAVAIIRRVNSINSIYDKLSSNNIYYVPNLRNCFFHALLALTSNSYSPNPFPLFGGVYDPNFNNSASTYKSFLTGESNSFYEKTQWNGYIPIGSTYADNGGVFINTVSTDFAGQNRSITNPDIGAYEFSAQSKPRYSSRLPLNLKVFLNNVNPTTSLMDNYLATLNTFPSIDPYSVSGAFNGNFTHVNDGVVQKTEPTLLNKTGNNGIVDWVFVELRQGNSGSTSVVQTQAALLQRDGDIVGMDGVSPVYLNGNPNSYYITIRHRNHLGFRTNDLVALSSTSTTLNFTNNSIPLFGSTPILTINPNLFAMNGGDANSDGSVDAFDTIVWEQQNGLFDDYTFNSDYNLDGSVDALDSIIWELNNGKFQELD